jgi:hypothetical protein
MSTSVTVPTRIAPTGPGRVRRHLGLGVGAISDAADEGRAGRLELVVTVTAIVATSTVVQGPWIWAIAALVLAGTILGTLQLLASVGADSELGVPVEALLLPSVAALGAVGVVRIVPLGLAIVPALVLVALLIDRAIAVEARLVAHAQGPTEADRSFGMSALLIVAFVAFTGVAAIVPNGLAGGGPLGAPVAPLPIGDLTLLALADAVVGGLLGYRAAALRVGSARDAGWAALTAAIAIALAAAAIRAMGVPRLVGPGLLMATLYLWDRIHATPASRRRDPRWVWETLALTALGAAVAFWNLRLIG